MNDFFRWSAAFETGFSVVDDQHRTLIGMINAAAPFFAELSEEHHCDVDETLDGLMDYALEHFRDEERLMRERGLAPDFVDLHVEQHQEFGREIADLRENVRGRRLDTLVLLRFLTSWLSFHILGTDQQMAQQLARIEAGTTAEEAYREVAQLNDGTPVKPLLEATTTLYRLVSSRNQALIDINRSLENKVAERTAELQCEKSELAALVKKMELTQSQLLQSEKMASIGQLAAGVAHEINNPVGFVNSNLGTLKTYVQQLLEVVDTYVGLEDQLPADPALRARLADLKKRTDLEYLREDVLDLLKESQDGLGRIKRIVADLKDFSHVGEVEWQEADINAGLESTLNVVWNELKYKAEVVRALGRLPAVRCLPAQLNQVFMNLLVNAAQAIEDRGTITISTRSDGEDAVIEIADTGKGISEENQQRIFEPFFTTKPVGQGTGLGLSIAWDIVRKHEGRLSVASRLGEGTAFTIRIPVAGPRIKAEATAAVAERA